MRKSTALAFALCGTLLLVLLFVAGRFLYINNHSQSLEKIAGKGVQESLLLVENDTELGAVDDPARVSDIIALLSGYTYTEYPKFFHPQEYELSASRLTVHFGNGHSIGVNADGYVFVNGKLRDIEGSRGKEFYHKLYLLFYPNAG
ncbi:hypothetical protein [Agathobaculum sp.]|uniref:hypothetical protein n=1 Tax=Agathobaculum sp. TaxID=2048138 RepID=UPI002A831C1E|nr:hypothetical protein [Agathobaculum sp.]MDY3619287.1 hypothetical protein [Agathobaculum sp.]